MSSEKRKRKRKGITGKNTLIALLIGVLIGGAAIYSTTSYFQPRVPTPTSLPAEIASVPAQSATPSSTPTGWDTEWSQKLNIRLLAQFDSSGQPAWDAAQHPLVYISSNGPGYGGFLSGIKSPGLVIIDANTYQVVLTKQYAVEGVKNYYESHGSGVSMDGKWIYIPTADSDKPKEQSGLLLVIDAKTLKLHQIIQTESVPHHVKAFRLYDGRDVVLSYTFNWQIGSGPMGPGSGVWLMDPNDNNRIVGGIRSEQLQGNPYLAFPHPDGEHLFISMPPGPIRDPDIREKLEGTIAVVDMKTWQPVKYYIAGTDPIFFAFTADGKYTFVHGNYGIVLDWKEEQLWVVEKGEASHNRGKLLGLVDPIAMRPVDSFVTGGLRADHAILHPDPARNEIWISYNSNFRDVVFDLDKKEVKTSIIHSGSTHNGAFVEYAVLPNGDWKGSLESDQAGLHNSSLDLKLKMLGVTQTIYGSEKLPVESARATGQ
ncbi:MAG: hypothetical protein HYW93_03760 [Thaumarchaeota archaeon]|nr:hypothetical protein [Nitrososphaerota archaeon]